MDIAGATKRGSLLLNTTSNALPKETKRNRRSTATPLCTSSTSDLCVSFAKLLNHLRSFTALNNDKYPVIPVTRSQREFIIRAIG